MKTNNNIPTAGTIIQRHGGDVYHVKLTNGQELICYVANRFRIPSLKGKGMRRPRIVIGDKVKVELDSRDFSKGMLVGFV